MIANLQYYMHDEPDAFRLELSGSLEGDSAQDVYHAWRTALSIVGARPMIADLTYITGADDYGRALLRLWRGNGVRIVARSASARALVESVLGERLPDPPPDPGLLQRLAAIFCPRRKPVANHTPVRSEQQPPTLVEFTAVLDSRPLAERLR